MSDWSSGLCACFENVGICVKTYFCPCIVAGQIGEGLGGNCFFHGFCSLMGPIGIYCGAQNRGKLREKYQIPVSWSFPCSLGERNTFMIRRTSQKISLFFDGCLDHKMLVSFELPAEVFMFCFHSSKALCYTEAKCREVFNCGLFSAD